MNYNYKRATKYKLVIPLEYYPAKNSLSQQARSNFLPQRISSQKQSNKILYYTDTKNISTDTHDAFRVTFR